MSWWNRALDEHRLVHMLHNPHIGAVTEYTLPVWRVNELLKKFMKDAFTTHAATNNWPRVAIAGWLDYMWLRAAITRPWENENAWCPRVVENPQLYGLDLPQHFHFHGITVFEGKNETGWVFA